MELTICLCEYDFLLIMDCCLKRPDDLKILVQTLSRRFAQIKKIYLTLTAYLDKIAVHIEIFDRWVGAVPHKLQFLSHLNGGSDEFANLMTN